MNQRELLNQIRVYFTEKVFKKHRNNALLKHSQLKSYKINPIIVKYLAKILEDDFTPKGIAKALYYPRVLGTSINTSFGTAIQKMFVSLQLADGSLIKGMDIEFIDKIDNKKKWCQLKAGPNTINSGDVNPIMEEFDKVINLARANARQKQMNNNDLILGILYGDKSQLSQHYSKIDEKYPVIIGADFWHRITGYADFYDNLILELDSIIKDITTEDFFEEGLNQLIKEIEGSDLLDFS